uniref:BCL2 interacting protein 3 n=1 Tax=Sus scrofa TaxID=9823 RepID=A0A8D1UZL3_PIG
MQGAFPVGRLWGHTLWRRESTRAGAAAVWTVGRRPARPAGSPRRRRIWAKLSRVLGPEAPRPVWVPPAWRGRVSAELEVVGLGCWELQRPREQRPSRSLFKLLASVGASRLKAGLYRGPGARPSFPRGSSGSLALFTGLPCSRRFLVSRKDKERGQRLCGRPCPPLAAGGQCLRWDLARRGAEGREGVPLPGRLQAPAAGLPPGWEVSTGGRGARGTPLVALSIDTQSEEDYMERRREVESLLKKNSDWIWDWSSRPENVPPAKEFLLFKHPKRTTTLSMRNTSVMKKGGVFSAEFLKVFLPSLLLSHLLAIGLGIYIGRRLTTSPSGF